MKICVICTGAAIGMVLPAEHPINLATANPRRKIARHRRNKSIISSILIRRRFFLADSSKNLIAAQSRILYLRRLRRWIIIGTDTVAVPTGQGGDRKTFVRLKRDSIASDWVMRAFHGERSLCAELIRFYQFNPVVQTGMSVAANQIGPVKILARFNNSGEAGIAPNSPAILTRAFGQGTVMMICSSADKEWNDWPKDITYVPFVNDMVRFLLRPSGGEFTARVNQPIDYTLGEELSSASATLKTPAFPLQDIITLEVRRKGIRRSVFYADTIYKGIYSFAVPGRVLWNGPG